MTLIFSSNVFSNVDIGVTSDGKTIVCHHPTVDIPYELTQVRGGYDLVDMSEPVLSFHEKCEKCILGPMRTVHFDSEEIL